MRLDNSIRGAGQPSEPLFYRFAALITPQKG